MRFSRVRSNYNKIYRPQQLQHYFLISGEKNILKNSFLIESPRLSNNQIHNYLNRTQILYQIHSMYNKIRERENMTLKYESKRTIFLNPFPYKLQYQLSMTHGRKIKTIIQITC